jgi:mitochondrial fission protein ELM1
MQPARVSTLASSAGASRLHCRARCSDNRAARRRGAPTNGHSRSHLAGRRSKLLSEGTQRALRRASRATASTRTTTQPNSKTQPPSSGAAGHTLLRAATSATNARIDVVSRASAMNMPTSSLMTSNMTGEAAATGRPVYVFAPSYGSAKFARFHESLRQYGATRALPDHFTTLQTWTYQPLDAAMPIVAQVEQRWRTRHRRLPSKKA